MRRPPGEPLSEPEALAMAMRFLGARDYACVEMQRKLSQRGASPEVAATVVASLAADRLIDDARFVEIYCRQRMARHFGPVKIRAELRGKGVSDAIIKRSLPNDEEQWRRLVLAWIQRRYRGELDQQERARLYRAGCRRGFSHDQVMRAIDRLGDATRV